LSNRLTISLLLPNLRGGGAERVAVNLANSFYLRGFEVDMVLLSSHGEFITDLNPSVPIIDLKSERIRFAAIPLVRYLREHKPDVLLAFMWPLTVTAIWSTLVSGVSTRVVICEHTTWSEDPITRSFLKKLFLKLSMRFSFRRANSVVAVSSGAADDLVSLARIKRSRISVIYNPITSGVFEIGTAALSPEGWWLGNHRRILAVGELKPIKDFRTLIYAFDILRKSIDARLLIAGEGNCRAELEQLIKTLNLAGAVFLTGFIKSLAPYYKKSDLFVLSSKGEGFGNVIVEALEAGTPVVSTDCKSGPREILADGKYGKLVPVGNRDAMARAMADSLLLSHDTELLKKRAQDFSIDKAVNKYLAIFFPT